MTFAATAQDAPPDAPGKDGFTKLPGDYVFKNICQGCHMPNAMGATGAGTYPALAGNAKLAAGEYPVTMVLFGRRDMPPFGAMLNDTQIANVVNYVRSHFGNMYTDMVAPAAVANAVADALSPLGIEINELPITPERLFRLIAAARKRA